MMRRAMGTRFTTACTLISFVLTGGIGGFFYAHSVSVMPGLDASAPDHAVAAMQGISRAVRNPLFFVTFFVTPVVTLLSAALAWQAGCRGAAGNVSEGIWLMEGPIVSFYGFPYPTRCVSVRLGTGALWIWSPIALSDEVREAVDALGPVEHLVSPNKLHHLALADWQRNHPDAALWGPRSTVRKRPDHSFSGVLEDTVPSAWANVIDQVWVRGSILLDEVVFFHRASRTVILGDLSEAFSTAFLRRHWFVWQRWIARLWGITEDAGKAPLEVRLSFIDRRGARAAVRRMRDWNPEKVIMAHGVWQRENGRAFLERSFSWLRVPPQAQYSGDSNDD